MQLSYVFSELGNGLKRNVSMTIAVIVTIFVSLTLVGMGLLLNAQADKAESYWGSKLQISVVLCNQNSRSAHCTSGETNAAQDAAIRDVLAEACGTTTVIRRAPWSPARRNRPASLRPRAFRGGRR